MASFPTSGDDTINDGGSGTYIDALAGADTVYGNGGNDTLDGNTGADVLFGGSGDDSLRGGADNDSLYGGNDNDVLYDDAGVNLYNGGDGDDVITATSSGGGTILGGAGNDVIYGGTSSFSSNFLIYGDDGVSGIGNDSILGNRGADTIYGGLGNDTVEGKDNSDYLVGEDGADSINGGASGDTLFGGDGNDILLGGSHSDSLVGGLAADTLIGGMQGDTLEGGGGDDVYIFTSDISASQSIITDTSGSNVIRFDNAVYTGTAYVNTTYPSGNVYMLPLLGDPSKRMIIGYNSGSDYAVMSVYYPSSTIETWQINNWSISNFGITLGNGEWFEDTTGTNDSVTGTSYGDVILAGGGHDIVFGYGGGDTIDGGSGNDYLYGVDDADSINGGSGNDEIHGNAGADTLDGGADFDTVSFYNSTAVSINLSTGSHSGGFATGDVLMNFEGYTLTVNDDTLIGDANGQLIFALEGADSISAGGGDDTMYGDAGADTIDGGDGADWMLYTDSTAVSINLLTGTHSGTDAAGDVYQNIERFSLSQYSDSFVADANVENIYGMDGDDTLVGGNINTFIIGGNGADSNLGGTQNDVIFGDTGADTVDGGSGANSMNYSASTSGVTVNLSTNINSGGYAQGDVLSNITYVVGSSYADHITGDGLANGIFSAGGNDTIIGGGGSDNLYGNNDLDTFVYQSLSDSTNASFDTISDFSQSDGDQIDLTAFGSGVNFIGASGSFGGTAKELRYEQSGGFTNIYYDHNGDQLIDLRIDLAGTYALVSGDFILA